jgi:hypothetical protein
MRLLRVGPARSDTVVAKKKVSFTDRLRFNGQEPVSRRRKATGRRAFEVQSAQAICAAYYFDLLPRDYSLANGAIELVIKGFPPSALIEPSQSCELVFWAPGGSAAEEKACSRGWQISSRFTRT